MADIFVSFPQYEKRRNMKFYDVQKFKVTSVSKEQKGLMTDDLCTVSVSVSYIILHCARESNRPITEAKSYSYFKSSNTSQEKLLTELAYGRYYMKFGLTKR